MFIDFIFNETAMLGVCLESGTCLFPGPRLQGYACMCTSVRVSAFVHVCVSRASFLARACVHV